MLTSRERFKANIRLFEIEPHSYCNRKCWFCPNSFIDRTSNFRSFPLGVYIQILKDLASIDYSESMCFAGWCEPWAPCGVEGTIYFIKTARKFLPKASLFSNSNTDFLTNSIIKRAADSGLSVLKCQLYYEKDEEYCRKNTEAKMLALSKKLSDLNFVEKSEGKWYALVDGMVVLAYAKDFRAVGHNRCDIQLRKPQERFHTCFESISMVGVNHNGWAVPCCNIRSDYTPHKDLLLGKVGTKPGTIFDLYKGTILSEKSYPCSTCMGKQSHPNHKMVFDVIRKELIAK